MSEPEEQPGALPLATWRVFWLVLRMSARRLINRLTHFVRKGKKQGGRVATAPKSSRAGVFFALIGSVFIFQGVTATSQLVASVARTVETRADPTLVPISEETLRRLQRAELDIFDGPKDPQAAKAEVEYAIRSEVWRDDGASEPELRRVFAARGAAGFRASRVPRYAAWPDTELWLHDQGRAMIPPLALVASLLGLAVILTVLAASERNLADVGARTEWLFSFPVRPRSLFLAQAASVVLTPLLFFLLWPFFGVVFWSAGFGPLGFLLALMPTVVVGLLAGALRIALETALRRLFSAKGIARTQAALGVVSAVLLVLALGLAYSPNSGRVLRLAASFDGFWLYQPLALATWISLGGRAAWAAAAGSVLIAACALAIAVRWSEFMARNGLVSASSPYGGAKRGRPASSNPESRSGLFAGVIRKDLRALFRDRQMRTQALITPGLVLGAQVLVNPRFFEGLNENPRAIATAAFVASSFVLLGSCQILASEVPTLWLLQCFPERLERVLLKKAALWGVLAALYACAVFAAFGARSPALVVGALPYLLLVLPGAFLYAVVGLGIGALGTNPHEAEPQRRVGASAIYLFLGVLGLFALAIHSPSWWPKLVDLCLSALLAFALIQKLRDRLPFLLDSSTTPAAEISVADGIMAALAFFGLQSAVVLILGADAQVVRTVLYAFVSAGAIVTACGLWFLKSSGLRDPLGAVGLRLPSSIGASARALGFGIGAGAAAALVGVGYLALAQHIGFMKQAIDRALELQQPGSLGDARWLLFGLVVLAAPLFEEFIFRGLLFRGFRRSIGALPAALASSAVFALVHPAIAALPVFVMAVGAAVTFERTRWLGAPIAAHMTYNAIVAGIPLISS